MIRFTNPRYYVKGICSAILTDVATGAIKYQSDKFNTGNVSTSVSMNEIRAGLGNGVVAIIPSDSAVNVEFNAADFSLFAKAAQVGATVSYGAPVPACQTVTANSEILTIDVSAGAPVAQLGYDVAYAYVQKVGEASDIVADGVPYEIDYTDGGLTASISGFNAVSGQEYKVWYFVSKATAQVAAIGANFDPAVLHFVAQIAVYANDGGSNGTTGTRVGWLYVIVPRLKLGGNAGVTGDQTANDTTIISGQALAFDETTVTATCSDCESGNFAYYVFVKDDAASDITGLALIGGVATVGLNTTAPLGFRYVLADGSTVSVTDNAVSYSLDPAIDGVSISETGIVTTGSTAGESEVTATFGTITAKATLVVG